jgi:hypothetical protein
MRCAMWTTAAGPALFIFLDIHPYLSNPLVTRAIKEIALKSESKKQQLVFVGHDIALPDELTPFASRFELEPMTMERVKAVFKEEMTQHQSQKGEVGGSRSTLESLLRHMVGLPENSVRHLARLTLSDGQICTADLARVLAAKQETLGVAELLVFEQKLPALDEVAGMKALKRWLLLRREPFLKPDESGLPAPRGVAFGRARRRQKFVGQSHCVVLASASVSHGLWRALRQIPRRERTQIA